MAHGRWPIFVTLLKAGGQAKARAVRVGCGLAAWGVVQDVGGLGWDAKFECRLGQVGGLQRQATREVDSMILESTCIS